MAFKDLPDHLLLEKCRQDDQNAFNTVFGRYFESVYTYALRHVQDRAIAEELAMDVLFRFWQRRATIASDTNIPAYLFTSVKNGLADHWRKKELVTLPLMHIEQSLKSRPADYELNNRELQQLYQQSVNALSPQCREVFKLSREEELTYPQIAERMNLSVNTVKTHMLSALKGMRLKLANYTDLPLVFITLFNLFL